GSVAPAARSLTTKGEGAASLDRSRGGRVRGTGAGPPASTPALRDLGEVRGLDPSAGKEPVRFSRISAGGLSRRPPDRLHGGVRGRRDAALGPAVRFRLGPGSAGDRGGVAPVLVSGQPLARLLRRREGETRRGLGRSSPDAGGRSERPGRDVESRRRNSLYPQLPESGLP